MPFRLLGIGADPEQAGEVCGQAFSGYARSGIDVTLVCAGCGGRELAAAKPSIRRMGIGDLVLLDYQDREFHTADFEHALADVLQGLRPHVVVVDGRHSGLRGAVVAAFDSVRQAAGGSAALPAKLYQRTESASGPVQVTTAIAVPDGSPELFVRIHPRPWVTGLLERDLFAGLPATVAADKLAS